MPSPSGASAGPYRLVRTLPEPPGPPDLDEYQRPVVEHREGPLLVLAGPGTGKTTTLVEAVAERVRRGTDPERLLVLTFSRRAAVELRDRIAARLGTAVAPQATTFHSFSYALVRAHQDPALFSYPLRLLSGPEQDVMVRELLAGAAEDARSGRAGVVWPDELRACLTTRGFADEVRAVLARSRELGLDPEALASFAARTGRPDWQAAAAFLAEYLDVLDAQGVLDYAELVHRAVLLAEEERVATWLRGRYDAVFVDEYQDTDPAQVRLLRAVAGNTVVAFGDPDQSIYAFRGADVGGILEFRHDFRRGDGSPAPVRVLRVSRRAPARLLAASRLVAQRMAVNRLPAAQVRAHRELLPAGDGGRVEVLTFPTAGAELDNVADILRRAHLEDGVPWGEMAVLVRAGARSIPGVRRALTSAGVPLEIDGDDLPLREEPAVAPLLLALRTATGQPLDTDTALTLLTSPLGGLDATDLRRLGRALREEERLAGSRTVRPSDELIAEALAEPERLVAMDQAYARGARHLGGLLREVRELLAGGGSAEEALWRLWQGTPWPQRLERAAQRGGAAGRNADRDLDAVCALFETAARAEERAGHRGALNFLEELQKQDIAADVLTPRTVRRDAVRLLTAHRSKGLQWRLVVVAGVQEGLWPDLRRRGSLLEADRIGRDGLAEPLSPGALLAEERRLFYVAVTRASERLVVTAVRAPADDGDQPSRFLNELGVQPVDVSHRPRRPLSVPALVAELRATTVDPGASAPLRAAAARRLARLAALRDDGVALVPSAHPDRWWGLAEPTRAPVPLRDPDRPVALSGSALDQLASKCSLQWFLSREVRADTPASGAQGFGSVVHVLADEVGSGRTPADLGVLLERLETVWDGLAFDAPWKSVQEKEQARAALERFLHWHVNERGRRSPVATEHPFDLTLSVGEVRVRIRGSMDRVERDESGLAYVVDFKTGRGKVPSGDEVREHAQLAVYQLAVRSGALGDLPAFGGEDGERGGSDEGGAPVPGPGDAGVPSGGAELVHLRKSPTGRGADPDLPLVQLQEPPQDGWVEGLLAEAAGRVLAERFVPRTGGQCTHCSFHRSCSARPEGQQLVE
ncbi:ATP-dependent helicase [Wenjunlia vitaminophila]|uniref:ATP-dependent helicase n=1 Tax=Wenjunlia vitaminophila TaxID=76728 RepID=UPI000A6F0F11|nr:ATP-dependent DNA helicase [Wenjunlia vitaminophila]